MLLRLFREPDTELGKALVHAYGDYPELIRERREAVVRALQRFLETHGDWAVSVFRVPCRISLNPHCEHQGAWVPYGLHARELIVIAGKSDGDQASLTNTDPTQAERLEWSLGEEIGRAREAWSDGWPAYLESGPVVEAVAGRRDTKSSTAARTGSLNYVNAGLLRLCHLWGAAPRGLRLTLHSTIPAAGGLSSSSALVVGSMLAALDAAGRTETPELLAALAGEAEWYVGTRGGSGDHAAMLLGERAGLVHVRFNPPFEVRGVERSAFPAGYELILANSGVRSEKSAEERLLFNRGVFAYRFAYLALREEMEGAGLSAPRQAEIQCLGDLHTGNLTEAQLYRLLLRVPLTVTPAELRQRFPEQFGAAARGCFGTEALEGLPAGIPLRGAAVYGLGRVDRGRVMPDLLRAGDEAAMREFGRLMSRTHDGDRLFQHSEPFTEPLRRLENDRLAQALGEVEAGGSRPLRHEPGFYGASVPELDRMVDLALETEGVLGAGLMGAGGGGYVLILARCGSLQRVRERLGAGYYRPAGREPEVESWRPVAEAGRLA